MQNKAIAAAIDNMDEDNFTEPMVDMEDIAEAMSNELNIDEEDENTPIEEMTREMLNPTIRKSLTKQNYKIIGSYIHIVIVNI